MSVATAVGLVLLFAPFFYVLIERLFGKKRASKQTTGVTSSGDEL